MPRCKGVFFLSMVIVIWVGSAILIQMIFSSEQSEFAKPLFLTYFSTSFFTLYLIPLVFELIKLKCKAGSMTEARAKVLLNHNEEDGTGSDSPALQNISSDTNNDRRA